MSNVPRCPGHDACSMHWDLTIRSGCVMCAALQSIAMTQMHSRHCAGDNWSLHLVNLAGQKAFCLRRHGWTPNGMRATLCRRCTTAASPS